jgi:hypothetical protein
MSVPKRLLTGITKRDGHRCAMCGDDNETLVPHHRANRGMGGRRSLDRLSNLLWLCSLENGAIESEPELAAIARSKGIKISGHDEPSHVPIHHAVHGRVLLDDDGGTHGQEVPF